MEVWFGGDRVVLGKGLSSGQLTDADGRFNLGPFPFDGSYRVTATDLRGRFQKRTLLAVLPDEHGSLSIHLTPLGTPPFSVEGVVLDPTGRPLEGIDVKLHYSILVVRCNCLAREMRTDSEGRFRFRDVIGGTHDVSAVDRHGRFSSRTVAADPGIPLTIHLE